MQPSQKPNDRPTTSLFTLSNRYTPSVGYTPEGYPRDPWARTKGTRKERIADLQREANMFLDRPGTKEEFKMFLESVTRVLRDRLNNNVLKYHSIFVGSTNPTVLCGYLLSQKPDCVSFRTKKILKDNKRVSSPFVVISFTRKLPTLYFEYESKSFDFKGVPHINKYTMLRFTIDDYGRVRLYFEQDSLAYVDGEWLFVP